MMPAASRPHGIYAFAPVSGWNNQQITKNCGLVPYLFHKLWGWHAVMVGKDNGPYPALADVPGLELATLPTADMELVLGYMASHVADMDVLVLHGLFPFYVPIVQSYRRLRPDGKIYFEIDANSYYEDQVPLTAEVEQMLLSCDVVGVSCRRMQRWLNAKWPCRIDCIRNGFYDVKECYLPPDFARKENIILTVGRLGTQQKRTEDLLLAFAAIAEACPGWQLRLVGSVAPEFQAFWKAYQAQHPAAASRVQFVGVITDKAQLFAEYRRAKIFALPSNIEGGTPNVIAEALYGGCYIVTSETDGAPDATGNGRCGQSYPIGNVDALAGILQVVCQDEAFLAQGGRAALAYGQETYDFVKIVRRLRCLLGLESGRGEEAAVDGGNVL